MLYLCYLCQFKPLRNHLRGFLIAAWAGDKIAEFSFPEISFHFPLRPWFFFVSPAYAGKSHLRQRPAQGPQDHPRMCGEKFDNPKIDNSQLGSPPHVRGKEGKEYLQETESRITPACAGKSVLLLLLGLLLEDHPRMCGEKSLTNI